MNAEPDVITMKQLRSHIAIYCGQAVGFVLIPLLTASTQSSGATFLKLFFGFALGMFALAAVVTRLTPAQQARISRAAMIYPIPPVLNALALIAMIGLYFINPYLTVGIAAVVAAYELAGFHQQRQNLDHFLLKVHADAR